MTWSKGHNRGQIARNRKLPADDILRGHIDAGMTYAEIGRRYGVRSACVWNLARARGWIKAREKVDVAAAILAETPQKVVRRRNGLAHFRSRILTEIAISLPRIPTLHGHFGATSHAPQGV